MKWKYVIAAFVFGLLLAWVLASRNHNEQFKNLNATIANANDSISRLYAEKRSRDIRIKALYDKIRLDSIHRANERNVAIPPARTLQNEDTVIIVGQKLYGPPGYANTRRALVASYGAQAVQHVVVLEEITRDQKAVIALQAGIVEFKDEIITAEVKKQKVIRRKKRGLFWKGFATGYLAGLLTPL